jgi:anti-anti-sigma regulatory factor
MKLGLELKEGISILSVTGPVDLHSFAIVKAGITKIFRDGKNRIALNLSGAESLDTEVIREIAILDILARELAGRIALVVASSEIKQNIVSFSRPPVVPIFDSIAQALDFFRKAGKEDIEEPVENTKELNRILKLKEQEIEALQAQLKQNDRSELQTARAEAAQASAQYKQLLLQVKELILERRKPLEESAALDKALALEGEVKELTERVRGLTKGA